jgi:hypothetical protein
MAGDALRSMRLRDFPSFICSMDPDEFMVGYAIKDLDEFLYMHR